MGGSAVAAAAYRGASRSTTCATVSSNAQGLCGPSTADTFTDTWSTSGRSTSRRIAASRRSASRRPSTASPSRLTSSRTPGSARSRSSAAPSRGPSASTTRCPTIPRSTRRATGTTRCGSTGATRPPTRTAARRCGGRNAGTPGARRARARAAARSSSGRTTPSTKPTANVSPSGSARRSASRSAAGSTGCPAAAVTHRRTSASTSGTSARCSSRSSPVRPGPGSVTTAIPGWCSPSGPGTTAPLLATSRRDALSGRHPPRLDDRDRHLVGGASRHLATTSRPGTSGAPATVDRAVPTMESPTVPTAGERR